MTLPVFFPTVRYTPQIDRTNAITLEQLCIEAGERCEAMGAWTQRPIVLKRATDNFPWLKAEPGDWGCVEIGVPEIGGSKQAARWGLGALAFVLFDGVARATIYNKPWARIAQPKGRTSGPQKPMSTADRQRKHRQKSGARMVTKPFN